LPAIVAFIFLDDRLPVDSGWFIFRPVSYTHLWFDALLSSLDYAAKLGRGLLGFKWRNAYSIVIRRPCKSPSALVRSY